MVRSRALGSDEEIAKRNAAADAGSETALRIERSVLVAAYRLLVLSREIDAAALRLRRQGKAFFQMSSAGHEIVGIAASLALRAGEDWVYPYYRDQALVLGLGVSAADILRQVMGKATDPASGGRTMPNHFCSPKLRIVSQSSPTGTQFLQAVGTAEAGRLIRRAGALRQGGRPDEVVYVSSGEGATSQGEFYEAVNAAILGELPVLFVIEDNEYAISVPVEEQTPGGSISRVLSGFEGLYVESADGLDLALTCRAFERAVAWSRSGRGPSLVHARVVRLAPHSDSDEDSAYRPERERSEVCAQDPLPRLEALLGEAGVAASELESIRASVRGEVRAAIDTVETEADPDPSTVSLHVFDPSPPAIKVETPAIEDGEPMTLVEAIHRTLADEMERNALIVVFGEDVADVSRATYLDEVRGKGGVFKVTAGLQRRFGSDRVFNTPLAEAAIVGRAVGMAVRGSRPVVEIQFLDFVWPAMNQLRSELALMRWRSNGGFECPVVVRMPSGGYLRGGSIYHSQSAEAIFCHTPGLRVVMPSNARDAAGLLRTALRSKDPVLFLEPKHLYRQAHARRPYPGPDYAVPFGRASTVRKGDDVTVVTYGSLVEKCRRAADVLASSGFECEILDLRSLLPYDWERIRMSVERTGRLVVVYEEPRSFGFGAEIAARAAGELFEHLDAPVGRIGGSDAWVGYAPALEEAALPQVDDIVSLLEKTCRF